MPDKINIETRCMVVVNNSEQRLVLCAENSTLTLTCDGVLVDNCGLLL